MKRLLVSLIALAACGSDGPAEQYGFVALLGHDTISVERVSRSPAKLVSDEVDRFPLVRQRHTVIDLTPDGKLRRMVMDIRTPNGATPAERGRRVVAEFMKDSVVVSIADSDGVRRVGYGTRGALTVPHVSMMYSVIELEIATSLAEARASKMAPGDSIMFRQFYPDRDIGRNFTFHRGFVHPVGAGKVELWHDWLSGIGDVTVDSAGRMLTYSGMRSTYKVAVTRTATLPDIETIGASFAATEKQAGRAELSVRDAARGVIGADTLIVDYGRPLARGRTLLGNVIDFDRVWRTGANAATQFSTSRPITLAGLVLPAGKYTLWTVPHSSGADLIVNRETGQWGTEYDGSQDLGRAALHVGTTDTTVEKFSISFIAADAKHGSLVMEWGPFRWTALIVVQ